MTRSMRDKMLAGERYQADDPELITMLVDSQTWMDRYNATASSDQKSQSAILREWMGSVGEGVAIRPPFRVDYGTNIHIGDRVFANYGLVALDCCEITIGDDCQLGPNVAILTPLHRLEAGPRRDKWEYAAPVSIGSNVWVGGGAMILPGVTVGDNAVIGSGSVVTRDIAANALAVGNPARVIRELNVS